MRTIVTSLVKSFCLSLIALLLLLPTRVSAGVLAAGATGTDTDFSTYRYSDPGAGTIKTYVRVPGASTTYIVDPGAPAAAPPTAPVPPLLRTPPAARPTPPFTRPGTVATIDTGNFITGIKTGLGVARPKATTAFSSDAWGRGRVEAATGIEAYGSGAWTSSPVPGTIFGTNIRVDYDSRSDIFPIPPGYRPLLSPYHAWSEVKDPITFTSESLGETFLMTDTLTDLTLDISSYVGVGGVGDHGFVAFESKSLLDQNKIYELTIFVPSNFGSIDVDINYNSIRGDVFDDAMEAAIEAALDINPGTGKVMLTGPLAIFPEFSVSAGAAGNHSYEKWQITAAAIKDKDAVFGAGPEVPEPSTLVLFTVGAISLVGYGSRFCKQA